MVMNPLITGTGLFVPENTISNDELVESFNAFVEQYNSDYADDIESGKKEALKASSSEFIEKASGIKSRYVLDKDGILDPKVMHPRLEKRANDQAGYLCEMGVAAAKQALEQAGRTIEDVDCVIVACSNLERGYPAVAVEIQKELGIEGFAFDMNVACSSATFGLQNASSLVSSGAAKCVLMVNPEICTAHLNFRDRDSHFIFGDVATAVLIEGEASEASQSPFEIVDLSLVTSFSNNIRNNFGFLNRTHEGEEVDPARDDRLFVQQGRKVFKEVSPMVAKLIQAQLEKNGLVAGAVSRFWLHQANKNMNDLIIKRVLGEPASEELAPTILDEFANTSSAGSVIAMHRFKDDLKSGDVAVLCSFGAGYSAGSVLLKRY